ncbi:MAG: serine/threonine-protein kinase [Candidatus Colwellbacteria bacterium]|nr:serine/threonine-protein kinase [Candidatus Colwellbacteria bacterium]
MQQHLNPELLKSCNKVGFTNPELLNTPRYKPLPDSSSQAVPANNKLHSKSSTTIGDYVYIHPAIGKGSSSRVYYGYHRSTGNVVAVKKISKNSIQKISMERITNEIELMKRLNDTNIVQYKDMIADNNYIYIITDYCNGGSLQNFIEEYRGYPENFSEDEVKIYMRQIRNALEYLVSKNIYHRDIKPHNIFVNYKNKVPGKHNAADIELKIGDFGFAKEIGSDDMDNTLCGTPMYIAPEIVYEKKFHINSDLWSIGIILFQLLYGFFPFGTPKNILELMKNIDSTVLKFPLPNEKEGLSRSVHDLLTRLLQRDPKKRITWIDFFQHRWFTETADIGADMLETIELDESLIEDQIRDLYVNDRLTYKPIVDDTKKKLAGRIDIMDNYCDRFVTSMPIAIPVKKTSTTTSATGSYKTSTSVGSGGKITDSIYKYISYSINNFKKYTVGK